VRVPAGCRPGIAKAKVSFPGLTTLVVAEGRFDLRIEAP